MGLILDSSVLIKAERQGQNARQMLTAISRTAGSTDIAISVVTLIELAHGAARADTAQRKAKRYQFIEELLMALPIHPVTVPIAVRVGQIDGENQAKRNESSELPCGGNAPFRKLRPISHRGSLLGGPI
jgi:predicted nucleic acid-binding protein